ncbi:putative RNA polymerase II subunit B1 CTD phosphatase RPAP2 homolog isoform X2 [Syzygium oleosum]|uniref:putative RNA polymerase II subunit B1 CTD phosphatase RPAP2 homolog isoform X2 n=1 Tax=Syzygium oleosum TaxID=219896 RepID=UPI0024BAB6E9|nr:putative RNA polymerase II subunit B1 CTD phosphatase RPAP2 homolog isoform X2 [Syzygium oleosum]
MVKIEEQPVSVHDAAYKLQHYLLEGIGGEAQLLAAGSILSRRDYEDVVAERSIAGLCGYPPCAKPLPSDRSRKGRYRISLKEHKVYDLHETYMYCSTGCVVNSRAFAGSLPPERCAVMDLLKMQEVLRVFGDKGLGSEEEAEGRVDGVGELGMSGLKIKENEEIRAGEVPLEEWVGPSDAIEGYVPQRRDDKAAAAALRAKKEPREGSKSRNSKPSKKELIINDMDFTSTIITQDEYSISKLPMNLAEEVSAATLKESKGKKVHGKDTQRHRTVIETSSAKPGTSKINQRELKGKSYDITEDGYISQRVPSPSEVCQSGSLSHVTGAEGAVNDGNSDGTSTETKLKPSLKSAGAKKVNRSVTWADEKVSAANGGNLCEIREMVDKKEPPLTSGIENGQDDENLLRFSSAEACAMALSQAAEAAASGESDAFDSAGLIILPHPHDADGIEPVEDTDPLEVDPAPVKWPNKPGIPTADLFDADDSWYEAPPDGFSLALSPFATMWGALFAWITSSTLAYIYGKDESFHEEYMSVNGREYPQRIVMSDGRSTEIKQTLAGCLSRALPGLVSDLRLPMPGRLLDTMSFMDALPALRAKQWQVIVLLFIDALSVCRVPVLTAHMTNRHPSMQKVLQGAQMSMEDYEIMKDLLIPLGRAPQFSAQSGA